MSRAVGSGLAAFLVGTLAVWLSVAPFDGRLSAIVRMSQGDPIAQVAGTADPGWVWVGSHYDGIYFYAIALDPVATGQAHSLIDQAAYRYGHPGYGWIAGALALFDPRQLPLMLLVISLASFFVAGFAAGRVAELLGYSGWLGLVVALNPGLVFAVVNDTSEAFGAALLLATLWAWLSGRYRLAGFLIIGLCFAKEPLLLVPLGLAIWEAITLLRGADRRTWFGRTAVLVPGPALYAVWVLWLHSVFGVWSFAEGVALSLPVPFVGWIETFRMSASMAAGGFDAMQIGEGTLPIQVVSLVLIVLGLFRAARLRSPIDMAYLLVGLLTCYLTWWQVLYPKDLIRSLAFIWVLLPFVLLAPRVLPPTRLAAFHRGGPREDSVNSPAEEPEAAF